MNNMKVITKKVVRLTDDPAVYLPVSEESYQYSGPVDQAVGYTVSGTIVDGSTNPISGVTVACTGQISATTGAPGTFSFSGLTSTITVTPSKTGWTFVPVNIVETTTDSACNFVGTQSSLATPTFSPVAGTYTGTQSVTLTSTHATHFFYTVDGTTPTETGGVAGPTTNKILAATLVQVPHSLTLKALAYDSTGAYLDSGVGSAAYLIMALTADLTVVESMVTTLIQSISPANPLLSTQRTALVTALANLRSNSLTTADLEILQNLLNVQYQQLNTAGPYQTGQLAAVKQALADIRSLL